MAMILRSFELHFQKVECEHVELAVYMVKIRCRSAEISEIMAIF